MPESTIPNNIKSAKKAHRCSWCPELIDIGASYIRYRYYSHGDAGTVKLHHECYDAMKEVISGDDEFYPSENPRGCSCGFSKDCGNCEELNNHWHQQQLKEQS